MEKVETCYFPESGDSAVTGMLPDGQFVAYDPDTAPDVRGHGDTRMAAIADLVKKHAFLFG